MIQLAKIHLETGMFIEDAIFDSAPMIDTWLTDEDGEPVPPTEPDPEQPRYIPDPAYIAEPIKPGAYKHWPRWNFEAKEWEEGGTTPEPVTPPPTIEQRQDQVEAALMELAAIVAEVL